MFADKIRLLRNERNMTQAQVGAQVGLTTRGYQNMELGSEPRYNSILRIAEYYDVSVDWLMGRTEDRYAHRRKPE